ncbi:hypothetical protein M2130_001684 [Polynucleobacter sphagniphilus]|nr:hypothetical protein [Polynucleobacter sphagniphilus]
MVIQIKYINKTGFYGLNGLFITQAMFKEITIEYEKTAHTVQTFTNLKE